MASSNKIDQKMGSKPRRRVVLTGLPGAGHELIGWSLEEFFQSKTGASTSPAVDFEIHTLSPVSHKQDLETISADVIIYMSRNCLTEAEKLYPDWLQLGSILDAPIAMSPEKDEPQLAELECFLSAWRDCALLADKGVMEIGARKTHVISVRFEDILFSRDVFLALFRAFAPDTQEDQEFIEAYRAVSLSAEAVNRQQPNLIWRRWSDARRVLFESTVAESMNVLGYEAPNGETKVPVYGHSEPVQWHIVSSLEPSAVSWLLNCFLVLGIRCERNLGVPMWHQEGGGYTVDKSQSDLFSFLPVLSEQEVFHFRDDIRVEFSHDFPLVQKFQGANVILFTRDPRDSIFSQYKRLGKHCSFEDYLSTIDTRTLLPRIDSWRLFHLLWLSLPGVRVYRCEDYRAGAHQLLARILEQMGLKYSEEDIARAVGSSTQEKTIKAEKSQKAKGIDTHVVRNQGNHGSKWRDAQRVDTSRKIESIAGDAMHALGYVAEYSPWNKERSPTRYWPHLSLMESFREGMIIQADIDTWQPGELLNNEHVQNVLAYLRKLNFFDLYMSKEPDFVVRGLLERIGEYLEWLMVNLSPDDEAMIIQLKNRIGPVENSEH